MPRPRKPSPELTSSKEEAYLRRVSYAAAPHPRTVTPARGRPTSSTRNHSVELPKCRLTSVLRTAYRFGCDGESAFSTASKAAAGASPICLASGTCALPAARKRGRASGRRACKIPICLVILPASPRRIGPVRASGKPRASTFSATLLKTGPSSFGASARGTPALHQELRAERGERGRAVRDQSSRGMIADQIELRERARRHLQMLRERARALLRRCIAADVTVAAVERGEERARGERDHRMHLRDACAAGAQAGERIGAERPGVVHAHRAVAHGERFRKGRELAIAHGEDDDVGIDRSARCAFASGAQRDVIARFLQRLRRAPARPCRPRE